MFGDGRCSEKRFNYHCFVVLFFEWLVCLLAACLLACSLACLASFLCFFKDVVGVSLAFSGLSLCFLLGVCLFGLVQFDILRPESAGVKVSLDWKSI